MKYNVQTVGKIPLEFLMEEKYIAEIKKDFTSYIRKN